jgi:hypothetical protein
MNKNKYLYAIGVFLLFALASCKKITPELNVNPNIPDKVEPKFSLSSALVSSADIIAGNPGGGATTGNQLFNIWMGYYTVSGDFIPNANLLRYNVTNSFGTSNWDNAYITMENYQKIIEFYGGDAAKGAKFITIARIMKAFHYLRLVDLYNNVPYSEALKGADQFFPKYDNANVICDKLVDELDACVAVINSNISGAEDPGAYDVMFTGNMTKWKLLANTIKLKLLMRQTQMSGRTAYIQGKLAGMTAASFIATDAFVQPGYANDKDEKQNPLWNDIGFTVTNNNQGNNTYLRANSYGVNFYSSTNDPRLSYFYTPLPNGTVKGRVFGSSAGAATEGNTVISGIGGNKTGLVQTFGLLKSAAQESIVFTATESLFLQAEAIERTFLPGNANTTYAAAVTESFKTLGVTNAASAATTFIGQSNDKVNLVSSSNRLRTIILQKWAALNTFDPVESWSDYRRTGFPADLPISTFSGVSVTHIPYRLPYPSSEASFNLTNLQAQGAIDPITSKIFWMP